MKKPGIILWIMAAIMIVSLAGCGDTDAPRPLFPWPPSGNGAIDSLMQVFQQRHLQSGDDAESISIVEVMDSIAEATPLPPTARSRVDFCHAQLAFTTGNPDRARRLAENMLALLDSATTSYDYHAWRQVKASADGEFLNLYKVSIDNLRYFRSIGDSLQTVKALITLSHIAIDIQDDVMAEQYFAAIDNLLADDPRLSSLRSRINVNRALVGSPAARDSLLRELRRSPEVMNNREAGIIVLQNSYLQDSRVEYLDRALAMAHDTLQQFRLPILYALKASYFLDNEVGDSAIHYARYARDIRPEGYQTPWSVEIYRILSYSYQLCGMNDSAYAALLRVKELEDTMAAERQSTTITATENAMRIKEARNSARLEKAELVNRFLIALLVVAAILFVIVIRWHQLSARHRLETQQSSMKIKSAARSLQAYAMAMDEHKKLVKNVAECVSASEGADGQALSAISSILKKHNAGEETNLTFLKIQNEVSGDFARRIKADFPEITENQLRLAQLIAAGVSNNQLSRLLNVTTDSVHKSRYRLRRRFGLDKHASLDEFLRRYLD